jgi:uncharacterized protein YecT (DUF1311 family)
VAASADMRRIVLVGLALAWVASPCLAADLQATCRVIEAQYPDLGATGARDNTSSHCVSARLYDGAGGSPDYTAARACALREMSSPDTPAIGGAAVLMMIYANGRGVPRDLDRAMAYACVAGGAPAEVEGRVHHLQELKTKPPAAPLRECQQTRGFPAAYCQGTVDFCDDITSGFMQGACAARASANEAAQKAPGLSRLVGSWPQGAQLAFGALEKAANRYFEAHADHEVDVSGTGRAAFQIEAKDGLQADFRAKLKAFEQGHFPARADGVAADRALNAQYVATLKAAGANQSTGITPEGIRLTQRSWLDYREAWVNFAAVHYRNLSAAALRLELTTDRTAILKTLWP